MSLESFEMSGSKEEVTTSKKKEKKNNGDALRTPETTWMRERIKLPPL